MTPPVAPRPSVPPAAGPATGPHVLATPVGPVQRLADLSVWLLFRITGVRC